MGQWYMILPGNVAMACYSVNKMQSFQTVDIALQN